MNWSMFWVLLIGGVAIYIGILFYSQRQLAYLSILLYRQGNADEYLKQLDSRTSRIFFNKRLRTMMQIDAYLLKNDTQKLQELFAEISRYTLADGDKMTVLEKQLSFELSRGNNDKAGDVYQELETLYQGMNDKQRAIHEDAMKESRYLKAIKLDRSGKYADELYQKGKDVKDAIPSGVYYLKAAQSYFLKKDPKSCREALERAEVKLRGTPYAAQIKAVMDADALDSVMDLRI